MLDFSYLLRSLRFSPSPWRVIPITSWVFCISCLSLYSSALSAAVRTTILSQDDAELTATVQFDSLFSTIEQAKAVAGGIAAIYPVMLAIPAGAQAQLRNAEVGLVANGASSIELLSSITATIPTAYLDQVLDIRGHRFARVIVSPFQNGSWYREVTLTLHFSQSRTTANAVAGEADGAAFDRVFSALSPNARAFSSHGRAAISTASSAPHPFDQNQVWTKMTVTNSSSALETDVYKVTGAQLAQAGYSLPLLSDQVRVFNAGGLPIEVDNNRPRPDFKEVAIKMVDGGDGHFDATDYLLFVGEKVDRWVYRAGFGPRFYHNIYTTSNVYWLGVSPNFISAPSRMATQSIAPNLTVDTAITSITALVHAEQDHLISTEISGHIEDYYNWAWTDAPVLAIPMPTPGRVSGDSASLLLIGKTGNCCDSVLYMNAYMNGAAAFSKNANRFNCSFRTTSLVDGVNTLNLSFGKQQTGIPSYFDYAELTYHRLLHPDNNQLDCLLPLSGRVARLNVTDQFASVPQVFDITDPVNPTELTGATRTGGLVSCDISLSTGAQRRVLFTVDGRMQSPVSLQQFTLNNLRNLRPQADLIIIAPRAFLGAIQEYTNYRAQQGYTVVATPVEEIMDNFGYGLYDPMAIRDYLKFTYESFAAPSPSATLLVGDANYDFLDHYGTGQPNYVPVSIQGRAESYSDDNYVYFGDYGLFVSDTANYQTGQGPDMIVGRWPVKSTAEIRTIIGKIKRYESSATDGDWRNRVVLVADDQNSSVSSSETFHVTQTEEIDKQYLPASFERQKIYMWDYPLANREKPTCNDAIVSAFNDGALIVNYVGHGNPDVWAHEHTFKRTTDLPRLTNRDKLPLVFAASCAIGFFDDPNRQGMGEDLLTMSNGGAIGVIAASRLVYAFENSTFNKKSYEVIFGSPELSIAEQFYTAKLLRQYQNGRFIAITNDQQYNYFGDPLLKLRQPTNRASIAIQPNKVTALARTTVSGQLTDSLGQMLTGYGVVTLSLLDADRVHLFRLDPSDSNSVKITYLTNGPSLFKGNVPVTNGQYSLTFIPPADISFGTNAARIVAYAAVAGNQAVGLLDSIPIADTIATTNDSVGPVLSFGIAGREQFESGDRVLPTDTLVVTAVDSIGINLSGSIGHELELTVDGNDFQRRNVTSAFAYNAGSYTTGSFRFALRDLTDGEHTLAVRGWDNANNSTTAVTKVMIVSPAAAASGAVLPYPNPMQSQTTFYFTLTTPIDAFDLEIFTLSGRKIRSYRAANLAADAYPNSQLTLSWDGRDFAGDRVASGVYLYRTVTTASGGHGDEQFGKIIVVKE